MSRVTIGAMPYLIDGHNVIGQTPGLSLDDPDDEVKLVLLIRRHCLRERRKATLIFDGGLPGGVSSLSTSDVAVIFASDRHTTADDLILNRISGEKNPSGLIVVTSDQKIVSAAQRRRINVRPSAEFGRALTQTATSASASEKERGLTQNELSEWEEFFKQRKSG
ncbi:MAG: NYN domain-containing protein [Chloroflexi bacterium]|nr:NYN domain-containing protein [Chloroflexota bacterium]